MILFNSIVPLIIIIVPTLPFLIGSSSDDWMIGTRVCQKDTDCDWACELGVCLPFNNAPNDSCKKTTVCRKVKGKQICVVTVRGWCETDDDCSKMMCGGGGRQSPGCQKWWCDKKQTKGNRCTTKRPTSRNVRKISMKQHVSSEDWQIGTRSCKNDADCSWVCSGLCFPYNVYSCRKTSVCREVLGKKVCVLAAKGWCENDDDCSKLVCGKSKDPNCSKWWCEKNKGKANMCTDKWRL